jgi:hypothetical protein
MAVAGQLDAAGKPLSKIANELARRIVSAIPNVKTRDQFGVTEKGSRKVTQQAMADKIGTSQAVINRQIQGLENLTARRIGEILWAIGWEPHFEARKIPAGENLHLPTELAVAPMKVITVYPPSVTSSTVVHRSLKTAA